MEARQPIVDRSQVGGHLRGDHPRVGRQQPEVRIQAAGAVIMVVVVLVFAMRQSQALFRVVKHSEGAER